SVGTSADAARRSARATGVDHLICRLAIGILLPVVLLPQSSVQTLTLTTGRGELLQFAQDVKQVAAAEPKIADVVVISPREVMVNAKEPGKTTVIVWEDGNPIRYNVDVIADNTDFDNFRKSLADQ